MKFNKIVEAIKTIFEVLINLHLIFATKKDDNSNEGTNTPQQENNAAEAK